MGLRSQTHLNRLLMILPASRLRAFLVAVLLRALGTLACCRADSCLRAHPRARVGSYRVELCPRDASALWPQGPNGHPRGCYLHPPWHGPIHIVLVPRVRHLDHHPDASRFPGNAGAYGLCQTRRAQAGTTYLAARVPGTTATANQDWRDSPISVGRTPTRHYRWRGSWVSRADNEDARATKAHARHSELRRGRRHDDSYPARYGHLTPNHPTKQPKTSRPTCSNDTGIPSWLYDPSSSTYGRQYYLYHRIRVSLGQAPTGVAITNLCI